MPLPLDRRALLGLTLASVNALLPRTGAAQPQQQPGTGPDGFLVLEAKPAATRILSEPAAATGTWAFNGIVPGPVVRVKKGEEVKVRLINKLDQPTSLHWHGVRIVNAMDGAADLTQPPVPPGGSFEYRFIAPDSGTYWYHPQVHPGGAEQIGRGLFGLLIVEEAAPPAVDRELLVVLDDWRLDQSGQVAGVPLGATDSAGATRTPTIVTVNSKALPQTETAPPSARLRLRIANVARERIMAIRVEGARPLIIAIDGQPSEPFQPVRSSFPIGPGARFDVMLDLTTESGPDAKLILRGDKGKDDDILIVKTAGAARPARPAFTSLPPNPALPAEIELQKAKRVDLAIEPGADGGRGGASPAWTINGLAAAGARPKPLFAVKRGTPVVLGFVNKTAIPQAMHVHGHVMRLLHDLDDGWEPYWRDSIIIEPGKTHHAAFVADNRGKWMLNSAMPDYSMSGMSTWFEVT